MTPFSFLEMIICHVGPLRYVIRLQAVIAAFAQSY